MQPRLLRPARQEAVLVNEDLCCFAPSLPQPPRPASVPGRDSEGRALRSLEEGRLWAWKGLRPPAPRCERSRAASGSPSLHRQARKPHGQGSSGRGAGSGARGGPGGSAGPHTTAWRGPERGCICCPGLSRVPGESSGLTVTSPLFEFRHESTSGPEGNGFFIQQLVSHHLNSGCDSGAAGGHCQLSLATEGHSGVTRSLSTF